jgi:hypothetical protein
MARITRRASPSRNKLETPTKNARRVANNAAYASLISASKEESLSEAVVIIYPFESVMTVAATEKLPRTATSKLALKLPGGGRLQREGRAVACHAERWKSSRTVTWLMAITGSG